MINHRCTPNEWSPASRTTDPMTSHEAEAVVTETGSRSTQCDNIYAVIADTPGLVAGEIAEVTSYGMHITSRRLADLKNRGLARQGQPRVWAGSGRKQVTWWLIPKQGEFNLR